MFSEITAQYNKLVLNKPDLYKALNDYCKWFNNAIENYQFILDDEWFEGKTTIEYQLRSLDTFNIVSLAVDNYENHKDNSGVWHLGNYQNTQWLVPEPLQNIHIFIKQNTVPQFKF